jgi:SAM-dependent methyltransferase
MDHLKNLVFRILTNFKLKIVGKKGSEAYWTSHMVPNDKWISSEDSLDHFFWRNSQYQGYIELMPVIGADDLTVLDYGCGPGNDLVGFSEFSNPARLIGVDVSLTALNVSEKRLALHGKNAELLKIEENGNTIPLPDNSVDLVHSSGVLHHVENLDAALKEIYRVLKPGGRFQVMVYNYDSLWLHLYTAYINQIEKGINRDLSLLDAFRRTTDGPHCPIAHCYKPAKFLKLVCSTGFDGRFKGSSISMLELEILPRRFDAIRNRALPNEHREFLSSIKFNENGHPVVNGSVAGINACYEFFKI